MADVRHSGTPERSEGGKPLPEGWYCSTLGNVLELKYGKSLPATSRDGGKFPVYGSNGIVGGHSEPLIQDNGLIVGRKGSYGEVQISVQPFFPIDTTYFIDDLWGQPLKYWYYQLKQLPLTELNRSTAIPGLNREDAYAQEIFLPPLTEQKVIADKLDTLLAQVETTKARLDRIPNILKSFRQSVLASAVSGKLTEEWRERHEISRSGWLSTKFSSICREITVGYVGKMADRYESSGIPFLRSQNVRAFQYSDVNLLYISKDFHKKIYKSRLEPGDLAIVRSGAPGTTCVIPASLGIANCSDLVIARPNEKLISDFGCIFMNSEIAQKNVSENQVGVAQQHFNVGSMKKMPIDLPSNKEQTEIVRRVEELFAFADSIEQKANAALEQVNNLTKSILAKAFRGELTADWRAANPELISGDNSAEALLAKIQAEREAIKKQPKPKRNAVKKKTGSRMSKQIIKIVDALKEAKKPLNGQELLAASGYPSDSNIDQLEQFFLDIREALVTEKTIVKIKRDDDGEDWFALAESAINE